MKKLLKKLTHMLGVTAIVFFVGCEEVAPEITEMNLDRMFSPIGLTAKVINKTQVVLTWTKITGAESYSVEVFSDDSLSFAGDPLMTISGIKQDEVPYTIMSGLIGQSQYSVRVKAVGVDVTDSKWSGVYFKTDAEQIMTVVASADIKATQVTLRWTAGEAASEIVLTTGTTVTSHTVTADEITAGAATITGLTEDASYTAVLMKDAKIRGNAKFVTLMDLTASGTIVVNTGDDLAAIIMAAPADSRVVIVTNGSTDEFLPGGLVIDIDKSISIRGYLKTNKPIIHAQFRVIAANASLTVKDVILDGNSTVPRDHLLQLTIGGESGDFLFKDCQITNYNKSLISSASGIAVSVASFSIVNCKVSNILTNSADCIDVRSGFVENIILSNSMFSNCAPARDFFRLDDASASFEGKTTTINVNRCSFNAVSNDAARRLLYVRFANNQITFNNNVVANSVGYFTNQSATNVTFSNNDYFMGESFINYTGTVVGVKTDVSGNHSVLDPGFVDATTGNLTITNAAVLDKGIGAVISW